MYILYFMAALATTTLADSFTRFDCGTNTSHAPSGFINALGVLHSRSAAVGSPGARQRAAALRARDENAIIVNAYFHVVTKTANLDSVTQKMADDQMAALNKAYNPYNIKFDLQQTTFTANDDWAVGVGDADADMKKALRQGTYADLNIYFQTDLDGSILGKCTLPSDMGTGQVTAETYNSDGCNVNANTMPGGTMLGYDQGQTAVHETGHWMGLLHTFEGYSCDGDGDFISDTPAQSISTDGCPISPAKDSCPDQAGLDPIHNIMDYSTDACYEGFSEMQVARMHDMWAHFRKGT